MEIDTVIITTVISSITTLLIAVVPKYLSRRGDNAKASTDEALSAKTLAETARIQLDTYNEEVIVPLKERLSSSETENKALKQLLIDGNAAVEKMRLEHRIELERFGAETDRIRRANNEQVEALQLQIRNLVRSQDAQREQIVILIEQSESKDNTIRQMQVEIEQLHRENEDLKQQVASLKTENSDLRNRTIGE